LLRTNTDGKIKKEGSGTSGPLKNKGGVEEQSKPFSQKGVSVQVSPDVSVTKTRDLDTTKVVGPV